MFQKRLWSATFLPIVLCVSCSTTAAPELAPTTASDPVSVWSSVALGSNAASVDMPGTDIARDVSGIAATGFDGIRLAVEWSEIEPASGELDWTDTDMAVDAAVERGLAVLGVVTWAPTWAVPSDYALSTHPAPTDPGRFAQFVSTAAARYKDRITAWQVWNEPNVAASFGPTANPPRYCALLTAASTAVRTAAPGALVIAGPTSPAVDSTNSVAPATFIEALYRCAGADSFDAVSMHPYSTPDLLSEPSAAWGSANEIARVREVMRYYGDVEKRIWFTEFGAPTSAQFPGVDSARQAEILVDGITALRQTGFAGPIFVFDYRDSLTGDPAPDYNYGLIRSDYSPKPALDAVRSLLR